MGGRGARGQATKTLAQGKEGMQAALAQGEEGGQGAGKRIARLT